jgi:glycosyltransferase involved in cell wall biosynthesis
MNKPKVSLIVFAYNQAHYIEQAAAGAFSQTYSPLEILLSDDGSSDDTFERMQALAAAYTGPHTVRARRTLVNKGVANHLHEAVGDASGELIIGAAGDDMSLPDRVSAVVQRWEELGRGPAVIYSDVETIDESGDPVPTSGWVYEGEHSLEGMAEGFIETPGASSAFTRDLIERFPPLTFDVIHEDRVLAWRALLLGGSVSYIDSKLVKYRIFGGVSRKLAKNLKEYLYDWTRHKLKLTLPDAKQRLLDLEHSGRPLPQIERACRRTILDYHAKSELVSAHWTAAEAVVAKHLFRGARPKPILRHYLKMRLRPLLEGRYRKGAER